MCALLPSTTSSSVMPPWTVPELRERSYWLGFGGITISCSTQGNWEWFLTFFFCLSLAFLVQQTYDKGSDVVEQDFRMDCNRSVGQGQGLPSARHTPTVYRVQECGHSCRHTQGWVNGTCCKRRRRPLDQIRMSWKSRIRQQVSR